MELEKRLEGLRALGMSEQQIIDHVHQELLRFARGRGGAMRRLAPEPSDDDGDTGTGHSSAEPPNESSMAASSVAPLKMEAEQPQPDSVVRAPSSLASSGSAQSPRPSLRVDSNSPRELQLLRVDSSMQRFAGPLPPPALAREYEALCPGFTDRHLKILEETAAAERDTMRASDRRLDRGQAFALAAALAVMAFGSLLAILGSPGIGAAVVGGEVVALVSAFLYRERRRGRSQPEDLGNLEELSPASPPTAHSSG